MPRILLTNKSDIGLAFIPWAQERYKLRSGIWYDAPHEKVLIQYNTVAGTILIKAESGQNLVCNPYKTDKDNYSSHFFLDATKDKIFSTETDDSWKEDLPTDVEVELVDEALFGNYIVSDLDGNNYSIIAPVHHLANEPDNEILIPSYTRYAWTTNVTGRDIHTCYSEYVYSSGEPVFRGTPNPPEEEFKSALILGVGLDTNDDIHVAQLVQINKDQGYWRILDKDGVVLGIYSGDESGAISKAGKDGSIELVWKNETGNRWFVEFHNTNCISLANGLIPSSFNVYRREASSRAGGNRQWFYKDGTWSQYTSSLPAKLKFDGIQEEAGLKKTKYSQILDTALVNSKPVVANHIATSLSGVIGTHNEITLPIKKIASVSVGFAASPTWPADDSFYTVTITKDDCVDDVRISCTLPNTTLSEIVAGSEYRVTLSNRCIPNQSAQLITGAITVSSSHMSAPAVANLSYTSRTGYWGNYVLTWQSPSISCSDILVDDIVSEATRTLLYRCSSVYPSYQESIGLCMTPWGYQIACTNDEGSFTREPEYLLPATFAYTVSATKLPACAPNCQPSNETMARNFWYIPTRQETYEWICT